MKENVDWDSLKNNYRADYQAGYDMCFCSDESECNDAHYMRCLAIFNGLYAHADVIAAYASMTPEDLAFLSGCEDGAMDT